jgi:23S rRNA G2069 N7-methylase RlmK/C1962 C5-methylase RlmI
MNIEEIPFQEQAESLQNQIVIKSPSFKKSSKLATVFFTERTGKAKKKREKVQNPKPWKYSQQKLLA